MDEVGAVERDGLRLMDGDADGGDTKGIEN